MKFSISLIALVATAYAAPLPTDPVQAAQKEASTLDNALKSALEPALELTHGLDITKRQNKGGPNFYDAGAVKSGSANPVQTVEDETITLGQVGSELGSTVGTALKPVLSPVLDLTHKLDITKRTTHATNAGGPAVPPPFGAPTAHNPNPNANLLPNGATPKTSPHTPQTGPTKDHGGNVHPAGSESVPSDTLLSVAINLKERELEAQQAKVIDAVVGSNGIVAGVTKGLTGGRRARALKH
ncbi:hypothetical protein FH972_022822 [Carpinus fangiana]|uniref:SMP domain-containing protein n=1 Tax=Carpinus fangiana TaxID=176857 RepID=A0A5N6KTP0_9ROSI|nr:hypothetical protein FH972_022822 [Carpinus fangiana]